MNLSHSFSPQALEDLFEIWDYLADVDERVADATIAKIFETIRLLKQYPKLGRLRGEFKQKPRSVAVESYVIFYRTHVANGVKIIRVLHGSRDVPPLLL